jgi:AraC-like DNA-binding protein
MLSGVLRFSEAGVPIELHAGEYYIQRAGIWQEGIRESDCPVYFYIHFDGAFKNSENGLRLRGTFDTDKINHYIQSLEKHYKNHTASQLVANSILLRIFDELKKKNAQSSAELDVAQTLANIINEEYYLDLNLCELAAKYHYSENYIIKIFRERYGKTPHKYLCEVRVKGAKVLMEEAGMSASGAAMEVGFKDFSTFYRNFTAIEGISPSEWKKTNQKQKERTP